MPGGAIILLLFLVWKHCFKLHQKHPLHFFVVCVVNFPYQHLQKKGVNMYQSGLLGVHLALEIVG